MSSNYDSKLDKRVCQVETVERSQEDEALSSLPIFQMKLASVITEI